MPSLTTIETLIYYRKELTESEIEWRNSQKHEKYKNVLNFQYSAEEEEEETLNAIKKYMVI